MKRFGALLMCVLMLASLAMPAYAADGNVYTITPSQTSAVAGDEIVFTVSVSGSTAVKSLGFIPSYDSSVYELVDGQNVMSGLVSTVDKNHGGTAVLFMDATVPSGVVGTFTLKVIAETATTGTVSASVSQNTGDASVVAASVEITAEAPEHVHTIEHVAAIAPACHYEGNIEYWYCSDAECMMVWQDEALTQLTNLKNVVEPALGGEVVHMEAVEAACHYDGNIEYWVCYECEQVWQDEALTQLTNIKNVVKPAVGGEVVHVEAKEPTATEDGNIEYWTCESCEQVWQDEALTQLTNIKNVVKPAIGGEVVHVAESCYNIEYWTCESCEQVWQDEALTQLTNIKNVNKAEASHEVEHVAESCYNTEYWTCSVCETYWADEALTQITNSKNVIKAEASHVLEHVAESCYNTEYWTCSVCETYWADEALTQITNSKNVIKAEASHELQHVEAVAATCTAEGNIEYWTCSVCETYWADEALTQITNSKNVIVPAAHTEIHVEAVEATCNGQGNIEHWYCEVCGAHWLENGVATNALAVILPALGCNGTHVEAKAPTCDATGNVEYWYCESCGSYYANAECTQLTNALNIVVAANGHSFDKEGICTVCGASETQTGDTAMIMVWVAVMALAAVAFVVVSKKRVA
ncbi:MAG: hypothetical protein J6C98_08835 [Oscillospiraceae bacterium]|nr:hypothetical protein [Oscillospiraceae bacterium]